MVDTPDSKSGRQMSVRVRISPWAPNFIRGMKMKGIVLAGGSGSRLFPVTKYISKQLLPVYNKPMIFYPLSTLINSGIKDILIITTSKDYCKFKELLGSGSKLGLNVSIEYRIQNKPNGIAEAFLIGEDFISNDSVTLILGDNLFFGKNVIEGLKIAQKRNFGATIFTFRVKEPEQYGVINYSYDGFIKSIEEKPKNPKSNWAVTGLYVYDNTVIEKAKQLKPSLRNELEITDINNMYLQEKQLFVEKLKEGNIWFDMGTFESLLAASNFVQAIEQRQGYEIGNFKV